MQSLVVGLMVVALFCLHFSPNAHVNTYHFYVLPHTYTSRDNTSSCRLSGTLVGFPLRSPDRNTVWWGSSWEVEASCFLYLSRQQTTCTLLKRKRFSLKHNFHYCHKRRFRMCCLKKVNLNLNVGTGYLWLFLKYGHIHQFTFRFWHFLKWKKCFPSEHIINILVCQSIWQSNYNFSMSPHYSHNKKNIILTVT